MSEQQAQRTLVKSPPELWAEISDVEALARHLGAFGEIRITRLEPETTVTWEGDTARGTVELMASGWGTKVTLTATATKAAPAPAAPSPAPVTPLTPRQPAAPPAPVTPFTPAAPLTPAAASDHLLASADQKVRDRYIGSPAPSSPARGWPQAGLRESKPAHAPQPPAANTVAVEPDTPEPTPAASKAVDDTPKPAERPPSGFFARLRWWFGGPDPSAGPVVAAPVATKPVAVAGEDKSQPAPEKPAALAPDPPPKVVDPEPVAAPVTPAAVVSPTPTAVVTPTAAVTPEATSPEVTPPEVTPPEVTTAQQLSAARSTAAQPIDDDAIVGILTGVLDDLGFANHRPFSRAD